ncbi:class I SAM-dependent methyltransferase [Microbacterium sp. NPDC089696]|uniref:class I SAM-dependent methyltransferase n=1 Tax=Microbacterium sp. NPDC089696 TaxID=3364199 RepID=UPI0038222762
MKSWTATGEAYAASYASLCLGTAPELIAALGPGAGRTLLDVGSGTSSLLAAFARDGWTVTGCEPEPSMRVVAEREHPEIVSLPGGLPELPFATDSFDVVTANFVLNHVADPRASATELARVSADRVAATIWAQSPSWFWREVCDRAGLVPAEGERLPAERDFARTSEGFAGMLTEAGWRGVAVAEKTWTWRARPEVLWISAEGGVASAGLFYRSLDDAGRAAFRRGFDAVCGERAVDGEVPLEHTAAIAVGEAR